MDDSMKPKYVLSVDGRDDRGLVNVRSIRISEDGSAVLWGVLILMVLAILGTVAIVGISLIEAIWEETPEGDQPAVEKIFAPESAPDLKFRADRGSGSLMVVRTPEGQSWERLEIQGCHEWPDGDVQAGQKIQGCSGHVRVRHIPSDTVIWEGDL